MGVNLDGERDVLGLWFQASEGAKFWMSVLTEFKQRGVHDVLIACVDGLKGFPEAIEAVFPQTWVQTCIAHLIRKSLRIVWPTRTAATSPGTLSRSTPPRPTTHAMRSRPWMTSGAAATR